jgi:hypothetical protein
MKESYTDENHYGPDQDFGSVAIRNYGQVLQKYNYGRYVNRFRALADRKRLSPAQRPKLDENEFAELMKKLVDSFVNLGEGKFLKNEKSQKVASRLLIGSLFNEEWFEPEHPA